MKNKTYISFVVQTPQNHLHFSGIVDLPEPAFAKYSDNTSQEVLKWSLGKQAHWKRRRL
jgi:hypothetical protein